MGLLFHLVPLVAWHQARASAQPYKPPTYDQDGFTHLTEDPQLLLPVANHFYKGDGGDWVVLCLDAALLSGEVRKEPAAPVGDRASTGLAEGADGDQPLFPHLYGAIDFAAVVKELPVERCAESGTFLNIVGLDSLS